MATTVLITGAGGLIGSWLCRHLAQDAETTVIAVRRRDVDLLSPGAALRLIETIRPDKVVHLAWCASGDPSYRDSVDNARWLETSPELREACRKNDVMLWLTGTVLDQADDAPDAYTKSKVELRKWMGHDVESGGLGWLRPHYVFDESARRPRLVAQALQARDRGVPLELQHPDTEHDFVHAADVGSAIATILRHQAMGDLPIGSGCSRRVSALVEALGVPWTTVDTSDHTVTDTQESSIADISRLEAFGWKPTRTEECFGHG